MELNADNITALAAAAGAPVAILAAWLGYRGGKAQATAALDGVKLQLTGEREFALWSAKRDAYASFLAAAETFRVSLNHAIRLTSMYLEEGLGTGKAATEADAELRQSHKALLLSQSSLRLSIDAAESATVDALTSLATETLEVYGDWVDALAERQGRDQRAWDALKEKKVGLTEAVSDWALAAQSTLAAAAGAPGGARP
ncbi:hypothetical protein [Streptomyces sp. NPDC087297]|uniref:hypothetical protein n=1 Tax=Streptomyces sp. NPDC087297 TaxID=3365778 RepID=UPI0037FB5AB1